MIPNYINKFAFYNNKWESNTRVNVRGDGKEGGRLRRAEIQTPCINGMRE